MSIKNSSVVSLVFLLQCFSCFVFSEQVLFELQDESYCICENRMRTGVDDIFTDIDSITEVNGELVFNPEDGGLEFTDHAGSFDEEFWPDVKSIDAERIYKERTGSYRNYTQEITENELKDIKFILKTLAQKSLASLWGYKTQLEHAGDRVDHIHPLRFLQCIFSDDELIVYINNIKSRGSWVWSEFISGFKKSLQEEADQGNLTDEHFDDFVDSLDLDLNLVHAKIQKNEWENFIKILIANVARSGDHDKYDQ